MKYENYLVAMIEAGKHTYKLARGHRLGDSSLAYCKFVEPVYPKNYIIIDVASGLFVITATSKKKLLELWQEKSINPDFINRIMSSRMTKTYYDRVQEAKAEKKLWRESGYIIEGEGLEL